MLQSVAHQYGEVARNLKVAPELLLALHRTGELPAIAPGRRAKIAILIADEDLLTVLERSLMVRAAKELNLNEFLKSTTPEIERLSEAILVYLERRYGYWILLETVKQVVSKLEIGPESEAMSQRNETTVGKVINEIRSRLAQRRLARSDGSEAMLASIYFGGAA